MTGRVTECASATRPFCVYPREKERATPSDPGAACPKDMDGRHQATLFEKPVGKIEKSHTANPFFPLR